MRFPVSSTLLRGMLLALMLHGSLLLGGCSILPEDGPYSGRPAKGPATGTPSSSVVLNNILTLEAFNPTDEKSMPLAQMRHKTKGILWTIEVFANKPGDTQSVDFNAVDAGVIKYTVTGMTRCPGGHEATWWIIRSDGSLDSYYNSW